MTHLHGNDSNAENTTSRRYERSALLVNWMSPLPPDSPVYASRPRFCHS